jgi:hypothetical protein
MKRFGFGAFTLLLIFLFGCGPENSGFQIQSLAINLATLKGLTVSFLYPDLDNIVNCPANEFNLPGQGYRAPGSTGGLGYSPLTHFTSAGAVGAGLHSSFFKTAQLDSEVGILVVDDFKNNVFELGNALFTQTTLDEATFRMLEQQGIISHGALVARHINDLIKGTGRYNLVFTLPVPSTSGVWVYREISTQKRFVVMAVNTHTSSLPSGSTPSKIIADRTKAALQTLRQTYSIGLVAINNSYVFMPCTVHQDFLSWDAQTPGTQTFQEYMQKLAELNKVLYSELVKAIVESTNVANDPLLKLIQDPVNGSSKYTYVASSGNYSLTYSMYPANWKGVVNVSGSTVDNPATTVNEARIRDARFFNQGEMMHVGASFELRPPSGLPTNPTPKSVYYVGTSYSTPAGSILSALDLAGKKKCSNGQDVSKLALNSLNLIDRHLEDWVVNNVVRQQGAVTLLCP